MSTRIPLAILVTALSASCAHIGLQARPVAVERGTVRTSTGVTYEELFRGTGPEARKGDMVTFDYTVWLENGERVDSTLDRGVPLTLAIGTAPVRGLDEGLVGMQAGGRRKLVVPPELGYGEKGVPDLIPPNAPLVFEVHLIELALSASSR